MYRYTINEPTPDSMFPYKLKKEVDLNNLNEKLDLIHKLGFLEDLVDFLFDDPDIDLESIRILLHANRYGIVRPINPRKLKEGFVHHECHVYFDQQLVEDTETGKELFLEDFGKLWGLSEEDFK